MGDPPHGGPVSLVCPVGDMSRVGDARRRVVALGAALDEHTRATLALVVTEVATNLARHARGGRIVARPLTRGGQVLGIEVVAVDNGPGMADLTTYLRDGYSTAGTAGHGLGAISRQADEFDLYSVPGLGTTLLARVWSADGRNGRGAGEVEWGAVCLPLDGYTACGDAWVVHTVEERTIALVSDGLGHGIDAAVASDVAVGVFQAHLTLSPAEIVRVMHVALRSTRGAAIAIAELDLRTRQIRFAGVGNIAGVILGGAGMRGVVSLPGIVGHQMHKVHEYQYDWPAGTTLVLYSDGVTSRWQLDRYPGLAWKHPSLIAATIARDYRRGRDDTTVLALRTALGGEL